MTWANLPPHTRELATEILTPRQLDVVRHRINGHSWRTIAAALNIDEATARGHHRRATERLKHHAEKDAA